ncbi:MAG: D-alanyl-D-alanine carboxypeptidase [Hyphomicrobiales bacterium]
MAKANPKYAAFVYDANKGKVLFSRNADKYRYPASLTKIMTLYLVYDAIDAGKITLNSKLKVSRRSASMPPSKLYLKVGGHIRVKDAILALVTKSANDVASTIAENLGGSESNFAAMMTRKARSIGMSKTTFANASGLPNSRQRTTARDMARLGLSIRKKHPRSFRYFATRSFKYGKRVYSNHNRLLGRVRGVNGIKTGYIRASGFNLVTNVETRGRHMVAVVMGGRSGRARNAHMTTLINRYISKASRKNYKRKRTPLLVSSNKKSSRVVAKAPLPELKPKAVVTASAAPAPAPKAGSTPEPQSNPVIVAANLVTDNKIEQGSQGNAANKPATAETATPAPQAIVEREGWKIQLSASPNLQDAQDMLLEASQRGASVLASKTPYTEPVQKGTETLYRVRFAGFSDQNAAKRACNFMKKKRYNCIYLN